MKTLSYGPFCACHCGKLHPPHRKFLPGHRALRRKIMTRYKSLKRYAQRRGILFKLCYNEVAELLRAESDMGANMRFRCVDKARGFMLGNVILVAFGSRSREGRFVATLEAELERVGRPLGLGLDDVRGLYDQQGGRCAVTKVHLEIARRGSDDLLRIAMRDPKGGFTPRNVFLVTRRVAEFLDALGGEKALDKFCKRVRLTREERDNQRQSQDGPHSAS